MKVKLLTTNVDIAAVAACGGIIGVSYFALFFEQYGIHLSIVTLAISLWGFLSIKQMDTQQDTPQPKKQHSRKVGSITAFIVLICGGLLFGTIKMIDVTQIEIVPCEKQTSPDCPILGKQQTLCPEQQWKSHCKLDTVIKQR